MSRDLFPIDILPTEVFYMITEHLSTSDEYSLAKVSKRCRTLVTEHRCRTSQARDIGIDFSKELLAIHHKKDGTSTVFVNDTLDHNKHKRTENSSTLLIDSMMQCVFFLGDNWNEYVERYVDKLNDYRQPTKHEFRRLRVFLPNGEVPETLLKLTAEIDTMSLNCVEQCAPLPDPLLTVAKLATCTLEVHYILSTAQILQCAVPEFYCPVTTDDAMVIMKMFYTETFPDYMDNWTFELNGDDIERLFTYMDKMEQLANNRTANGPKDPRTSAIFGVSPNKAFLRCYQPPPNTNVMFERRTLSPEEGQSRVDLQPYHDVPF